MTLKRALLAAAFGGTYLTITACSSGQESEASADFHLAGSGRPGVFGFLPTGSGWKAGSKVEVSIWHEPNGPGSVSAAWKKILDETVDKDGMFGFAPGAPFYPVGRTICGTPGPGQTMMVMAKNVNTGTVRMRQVPVDLYYNFQPCRPSGPPMMGREAPAGDARPAPPGNPG